MIADSIKYSKWFCDLGVEGFWLDKFGRAIEFICSLVKMIVITIQGIISSMFCDLK